jgi:ribosome-binding ATPase YchF (GTP1/OBG family)
MSVTDWIRAAREPFGVGRGLRRTPKKQQESGSSTIAALRGFASPHPAGGSQNRDQDRARCDVARIIRQTYDLLKRMTFFTHNEEEVRAWETNRAATALECAGTIHTDLARGFIRAEVVSFDDLMAAGSYPAARSQGKIRLEGKEAIIHDGDVVLVRFNV